MRLDFDHTIEVEELEAEANRYFVRARYLSDALEEARADAAKYRRERDVLRELLVCSSRSDPDLDRLGEIFRMLEASA